VCRAQERIVFEHLRSSNLLPCSRLDAAVTLTPEAVGGMPGWRYLLNARSSLCPATAANTMHCLEVKHLAQNGIQINKHIGLDGKASLSLVAIAAIPHFGLADVREIVAAVHDDLDDTLPVFRPQRVVDHYHAEALRIAKELGDLTAEQVARMATSVLALPDAAATLCMHGKPIFCHLEKIL
jgi:DNA mismatch repair protein PMS1